MNTSWQAPDWYPVLHTAGFTALLVRGQRHPDSFDRVANLDGWTTQSWRLNPMSMSPWVIGFSRKGIGR
jgi:hypothetical protein